MLLIFIAITTTGSVAPTTIARLSDVVTDIASGTQFPSVAKIIFAPATGGGNITFTGTANRDYSFAVYSFYNVDQGGIDTNATTNTNSGTTTSLTFTPTVAGNLMVAFFANSSNFNTPLGWEENVTQLAARFFAGNAFTQTDLASHTFSIIHGTVPAVMFGVSLAPAAAFVTGVELSEATNGLVYDNYKSRGFIGFARTSAGAFAQVDVTIGGLANGLTGISPTSPHYLSNTPGAIQITPGTIERKVGIAKSTTEIVVTNIW